MKALLKLDPEVREAAESGIPVLALESAIIAHGLAYPENLEFAAELHNIVRDEGAVPAMIAIEEGVIRIGLASIDLGRIINQGNVAAVSRRDLPGALLNRGAAATTVSATMACAHMAGIRVFAAGGIGGVHRRVCETYDVSADLDEFCRSPVAVVSSGAKSILDLPKTLEYLETRGVPVVGYGTDEFPAYYSRSSGLPLPFRLDSPQAVAELLLLQDDVLPGFGTLICNPVPTDQELSHSAMEVLIEQALAAAELEIVAGKAVTPFLIRKISEWSGGNSRGATMALARSNTRVGAAIAVAYHRSD